MRNTVRSGVIALSLVGVVACNGALDESESEIAGALAADATGGSCDGSSEECPAEYNFYVTGGYIFFMCFDSSAYAEAEAKCFEYCSAGGCTGNIDDVETRVDQYVRGARWTTNEAEVVPLVRPKYRNCVEVYKCKCLGDEAVANYCADDPATPLSVAKKAALEPRYSNAVNVSLE